MNIISFTLQILNKLVHQLGINTRQSKDNFWFQNWNNFVFKARLVIKLETGKPLLFFKYFKNALLLLEEAIK
jgi:hypothetical protein